MMVAIYLPRRWSDRSQLSLVKQQIIAVQVQFFHSISYLLFSSVWWAGVEPGGAIPLTMRPSWTAHARLLVFSRSQSTHAAGGSLEASKSQKDRKIFKKIQNNVVMVGLTIFNAFPANWDSQISKFFQVSQVKCSMNQNRLFSCFFSLFFTLSNLR